MAYVMGLFTSLIPNRNGDDNNMIYVLIALAGASAGLAVYFGFKAGTIQKEETDTRIYYVKITAILTGFSVILQGLLCLI